MPFSADQWASIYDKHCDLLEDIRRQSRRDFTAWTRMLYQELRCVSHLLPPTNGI